MNKEKVVMLVSVALLIFMGFSSWNVTPELQEIGKQRKTGLQPVDAGSNVSLVSPDISSYLAAGDNPFVWKGEIPEGPPPVRPGTEKPEPTVSRPGSIPVSVKPIVSEPEPVEPMPPVPEPPGPPTPPLVPVAKYTLPLVYVGIVLVEDGKQPRQAMFKDEKSGEHVELIQGQEYNGITLLEVRANSVILSDSEGRRFELPHREGGI